MALPSDVNNRTVVAGSGPHAAVFAATWLKMGREPVIVLERRNKTGGMFADFPNFQLNSANGASLESLNSPGPTRIPSRSDSDDLNWLPNCPYQVRDMSAMVEFPYSLDMAKCVQRTLEECAAVYTGANFTYNYQGACYSADKQILLGQARRVIFAGGLTVPADVVAMTSSPAGAAVMSGYDFIRKPPRLLAGKRMAVVGGGNTACQCVAHMLGQGTGGVPLTPVESIDWYGGENMPADKDTWMRQIVARWSAIGRHMPQDGRAGVIRPHNERGLVVPAGDVAFVNGATYDLVVMATGFERAPAPVSAGSSYRLGGMTVAKWYDDGSGTPPQESRVFKIGTAAGITETGPYTSRFGEVSQSLAILAPRTAAFAASLPA